MQETEYEISEIGLEIPEKYLVHQKLNQKYDKIT